MASRSWDARRKGVRGGILMAGGWYGDRNQPLLAMGFIHAWGAGERELGGVASAADHAALMQGEPIPTEGRAEALAGVEAASRLQRHPGSLPPADHR